MLSIVLGIIFAKHFENFSFFRLRLGKEGKHNIIVVGPCEIPGVCNESTEIGTLSLSFST